MSRFMRSDSLASLEEANLSQTMNKEPKIGNYVCKIINYISLYPTIIYNIVWLYFLKNGFESIVNEEEFREEISKNSDCLNLYESNNSILIWVIFYFTKAILFIISSYLICGQENDCNIICLFLKIITSYFPSVYCTYQFSYAYELKSDFSMMSPQHKKLCNGFLFHAMTFYTFETYYCAVITFIFLFLIFGPFLMALKELWKANGYHRD